MDKVVLKVELDVEKAKVLVSLLRIAAWREFWRVERLDRLENLRNERLLKDLASDFQQAITKQIRMSKEVQSETS